MGQDLGSWGEETAKIYLKKKGYRIIDSNFEVRHLGKKFGQIDIIAQKRSFFKKNPLCFFEIKTAYKTKDYLPEDKIDFIKKEKLKKLAQIYLSQKKFLLDIPYQIDVISVIIDPLTFDIEIFHYPNAICDENEKKI